MVRPWVKVSLHQYEKLKKIREETGRPLSQIIREAVSKFAKKKDFPVSTTASYLPKGTKGKYKSVSAYFARSDWNLLEKISRNTGRLRLSSLGRLSTTIWGGEHESTTDSFYPDGSQASMAKNA